MSTATPAGGQDVARMKARRHAERYVEQEKGAESSRRCHKMRNPPKCVRRRAGLRSDRPTIDRTHQGARGWAPRLPYLHLPRLSQPAPSATAAAAAARE